MTASAAALLAYQDPSWNSGLHRRRRKFRHLIAGSHHLTFTLGRYFPKTFPFVFVIGFPKSGTSWVCQMIAEYMRLPFPQNAILPIGFPAVVHGHETTRQTFPNAVYVMRDGRDAMASLYHHICGQSHHDQGRTSTRKGAEPASRFEDFVCDQLRRPTGSKVHWGEHVQRYLAATDATRPRLIRYESLLSDPVATLTRALDALTGRPSDGERVRAAVDKFAFDRQRKGYGAHLRQKQDSDPPEDRSSYLRKGTSGDWRNHFTAAAASAFAHACGDTLIASGYETDDSWVSTPLPAAA